MSKHSLLISCLVAVLTASGATAQLVGDPVGGVIGGVTGPVTDTVGQVGNSVGVPIGNSLDPAMGNVTGLAGGRDRSWGMLPTSLDRVVQPMGVVRATPAQLAQWRKARLALLVRSNRDTLDRDPDGQPVRKGELIVTDPDPAALAAAQRAGFRITATENVAELDLRIVTLALPRGMDTREGLAALRNAAPALQADYNHIYEPAGGALLPASGAMLAAATALPGGTRVAMIDGGVAAHPSLAHADVEQRGFAGSPQPTGHGTAVGSLLVGEQGAFRGAARGAQLFVGDVYGGNPAAGSATTIVRALAWAASKRPVVINISLVGPDNLTMARAVSALRARGITLVAPVGNDGPAAPPQFPASYAGVIAVTGVDATDKALREAGRATHLDFAAPGADLVAALPGKGYTSVRGTSFASPFVAARVAATGSAARLAAEAEPGKGKVGRGIVCRNCRVSPRMIGLR
jgi:hypothetical protein